MTDARIDDAIERFWAAMGDLTYAQVIEVIECCVGGIEEALAENVEPSLEAKINALRSAIRTAAQDQPAHPQWWTCSICSLIYDPATTSHDPRTCRVILGLERQRHVDAIAAIDRALDVAARGRRRRRNVRGVALAAPDGLAVGGGCCR